MATKKTTTVPEPLAPVAASTVAAPASLVVNKPKKVTVKKKTATKKPAAKKHTTKKVTAVKQPTAKKPMVSAVKKSAAKAAKKKTAKKKTTTQEPVVAVERVTVFSEDLQPRGRFTLVHVGELYLVSIFFALVILGITYWAVALSNTVQWAQTLTSSSEYVVEHVMRLALL